LSPQSHARHFDALDALRGLAAFAVVVLHYTEHSSLNDFLPGAWVAVDLFFVLSGFVLMHSYGERILTGMRFSRFVRVRLTRLGPMYVMGSLLGIISAVMLAQTQTPPVPGIHQLVAASVFGVLGLPFFNHGVWPFGHGHLTGPLFPLEVPAWSLFFEAVVNVLFFAWLKYARRLSASVLSALAFIVFIVLTAKMHVFNPGWGTSNFWLGFPRVIAEFFLGAWLYQLRPQTWRPHSLLAVGAAVLFFGAMFSAHPWINFFDALLIAPLTVALAASLSLSRFFHKTASLAGKLSYPLYLVHYPLYRIASSNRFVVLLSPRAHLATMACLALTLAWAFLPVDTAIRQWLEGLP
jgi:peptidoglycan/LPS O-acetylase OafA/YrhL